MAIDTGLEKLIIRHPVAEDAQAVVDLMIYSDIAEYGEPDSDLGSLADQWSKINLDQDAWLAYTPEKQLVGYAAVDKIDRRFTFDLYRHPELAPARLVKHLLTLCETRAREQMGADAVDVTATIYVPEVNETNKSAVHALGYKPERYHFGMRIQLDDPPAPPVWPVAVTLRNVVPDTDDRVLFDFIKIAFDRPGRPPFLFDRWHDFMMGASNFNPELWFLAYHEEDLIGAILCFEYPQYGWVRQLGVDRAWRGKGIGSALLQHIFGVFHRRGFTSVGLGVAADNPNAYQLYERVGMKRTRQYAEYCKKLMTGESLFMDKSG